MTTTNPVFGLDLGSTRFKAARFAPDGTFARVAERAAPALRGHDPHHEFDPRAVLDTASDLLDELAVTRHESPRLGIASQRSSFVAWDAQTGKPLAPALSWKDRRAVEWCERHRQDEDWVRPLSGLPLSPHYLGPKFACLAEACPGIRAAGKEGRLRVGTLDTWLLWNWSGGAAFETDTTMAARTSLLDGATGTWHPDLCKLFGVPPSALPRVNSTRARNMALPSGVVVTATVADQAACFLAATAHAQGAVLVNMGTGVFVLRPLPGFSGPERWPGYLISLVEGAETHARYAVEGTVNAGGGQAEALSPQATTWQGEDEWPDAFCLPDAAGVGAPYWLPDRSTTWSDGIAGATPVDRRRVLLEGLLFRVRGILEDLGVTPKQRLLLSGGLSHDAFVRQGLASCINRPVEWLEESEATLAGAGWLASGAGAWTWRQPVVVMPDASSAYLATKYRRWKSWLDALLISR